MPTPISIIMTGGMRFRRVTTRITAVGMSENRNALTIVAYCSGIPGTMQNPTTMARDAPSPAPDDIPVVYGSARGLRIMYCIAHPAAARPAPTVIAVIALGRRDSHTMYLSILSTRSPTIIFQIIS